MVLVLLRCSVVGKWTGGASGTGEGKLGGDYKVWEAQKALTLWFTCFYLALPDSRLLPRDEKQNLP